MRRFDGSLARQFDFGDIATSTSTFPPPASRVQVKPVALKLAGGSGGLRGQDKYKVLEHRRRQAQITARRLLDLL